MPSPLEYILSQGPRDEDMQRALAGGLRRRQEISELGQLTGDRVITPMAQNLGQGVQRELALAATQKEKEAQRELTGEYYEQQASQSALANTMAERRLNETIRHNKAMEERALTTASNRLDADTRRLSAALTKAQAPEITSGIAAINAELAPYIENEQNLPGVGGLANILPGLTADARTMQDRLAKIRNIILKARSGGAVTPQEADRLLQEFSVRTLNTDEDFLRAWGDFTSAYETGIANIYAGYNDQTIDQYNQNLARQAEATGPEGTAPSAGASPNIEGPKRVNWGDL